MTNEFIQQNFVTPEIAKALKELGFNEPCFYVWWNNKGHCELLPSVKGNGSFMPKTPDAIFEDSDGQCMGAPFWQQVKQWLVEKHGLFIEPTFDFIESYKWNWVVIETKPEGMYYAVGNAIQRDSLQEAEIEGFKFTLELLKSQQQTT